MSLCRISFFRLTERASDWSAWNCIEFTECFLFCTSSQLSRLTGHWRALWSLWLQLLLEPTLVQHGELSSTLLSLTKDCHGSHWRNMTNWWTTHWGLINWLRRLFPLWKVCRQHFLDLKLQNSMTSSSSLSVSLPWSQTVRNWKALLWALSGHQLHWCREAGILSPLRSPLETALLSPHCTVADARTGDHWRLLRYCFPAVDCHTTLTPRRSSTATENADLKMLRSSLGLPSWVT